jgi:purine-binding chemotaxis protein CheW
LVYALDDKLYALPVGVVRRVVRAVQLTPLPRPVANVPGLIHVNGDVVPVLDGRRLCGLPERSMELEDRIILLTTSSRTAGLLVDRVQGVVERPLGEVAAPEDVLPGMEGIEGVVKIEEDIALVNDVDRFLGIEDERRLDAALSETTVEEAR